MCEWFFNKYMFAFTNGPFAKIEMKIGWCNYIHCIYCIDQGIGVQESCQLKFFTHFLGHHITGIVETNNLHITHLLPVAEMIFAKMTHSENPYFQHTIYYAAKDK